MIVGLTGGIGSGKSTVAGWLKEEGITVVDADQVARQVVEPGTEGLQRIVEHFGAEILTDDQLNRTALRQRIFANEEERKWLEALLHPLIRQHMMAQLQAATSPYAVLEAPLLFENNLQTYCAKSILVDCPEALQRARASARDGRSEDEIQAIIDSQMPRTERQARADYRLENDNDLDALKLQTLRLHNILLLLAQNPDFA